LGASISRLAAPGLGGAPTPPNSFLAGAGLLAPEGGGGLWGGAGRAGGASGRGGGGLLGSRG